MIETDRSVRFMLYIRRLILAFASMTFLGFGPLGCASYRSVENAAQQAVLPSASLDYQDNRFSGEEPVADWWSLMEDKNLAQLIERALRVNHDLRIALSAVNESRALLQREKLEYLPSVTAATSTTREKRSAAQTGSEPIIGDYVQAGFDVSWELDLFGRIGNQIKFADAQLQVREADFYAAQISLAAEVAQVYLRLRGTQQLVDIAQRSVDLQQQNLRLVKGFAEVGRSSSFDVARATSQLQLTAARLPTLHQEYRIALNRLGVLTNQPAVQIERNLHTLTALPSMPASVAVGNAQSLLKRRPDIVQAERVLQGSVAEYNIQVADLYPQISLTGGFGYLSAEWSEFGREPSETFFFAPTIRWAALDLTRVHARINAADARAQGRLANFEKTVLTALQETDDALTRFTQEEVRVQRLRVAASESARAAQFAQQTYQIGRGDLRDVLDAEQVRLSAAQQLVQSEITILLNLVDIYKNLGGGWDILPQG